MEPARPGARRWKIGPAELSIEIAKAGRTRYRTV